MATGCKHRTDSPCLICKAEATASVAGCMHTPGGKGTDTQGCHRCHAEVYNCDRDGLMSDRHPKWQRVEPGTVIPAGQPYRTESRSGLFIDGATSCEFANGQPKPLKVDSLYDGAEYTMRVDSSWKPPLVLPTDPTWGIAVFASGHPDAGLWRADDDGKLRKKAVTNDTWQGYVEPVDFIPLTDEQVARIEAAR